MLRLSAELTEIVAALRDRGIPALPYKGPTLAARLYHNLALRASGDLDIVVRRADVPLARALLVERGYQPMHPVDADRLPFMLASRYSETMVRPDVAQVELHWAFTNRDVPFDLDLESLLPRTRMAKLGSVDLAVLGSDDLALILCVHGAKHRWNRLEWIAGLATHVGTATDLNYDVLLKRAHALHSRRRVLLGLLVIRRVLDAPVPNTILRLARADRMISALCDEVLKSLETVHGRVPHFERAASLPFDWFHLRLGDSFKDRLRLVSYRLTTPGQPELWNTVTWGKHSLPLHALVRPLRVAVRIVPATWSFLQQRQMELAEPSHRSALGARRLVRTRDSGQLRILQLVQKPQRRGAEIFAQQLTDQFTRLGHETTIAYLYKCSERSDDQLELRDGDVILGESEDHFSETAPGMNFRLATRLRRHIEEFEPDIVQLNGARTVKYGALLRLISPTQPWRIVYRNIGDPRDWMPRGPKLLMLRRLMREIDGTIGISRDSLASLRAIYRVPDPAVVIPNGILPDAVQAKRPRDEVRQELGANAQTAVVLFVGSLTSEKRVDLLLNAFADVLVRSPNARLWIVGGGPLRAGLESQSAELDLGAAVRFLGLRADVGTILAAADILALASDTEGMPAVALEAGYHGLPVISTRVGSIADCVLNGETGLLVDRGDTRQLADAMHSLVDDVDRRRSMGNRAHVWISEHFTIDRVAEQYLRFYRAVLRAGIAGEAMPSAAALAAP
jgi:glycosyltransferase involved in cell wall biosynthesis